jgi:hypothetical protein
VTVDRRGSSSSSPVDRGTRVRQVWTIARIELRRVFFARRGLWVYALALLPAVIFFGHGVDSKFRRDALTRGGLTDAALIDSVREGETFDDVRARLGSPARENSSNGTRSVRQPGVSSTTTHVMEPPVDARFVRLNVARAAYDGESVARIYEFEVYGPDGGRNLALHQTVTGSDPCREDRGPEKAVNGSVSSGEADSWCSGSYPRFLQVDLGAVRQVSRFVVKHASAGGESEERDTREFSIQTSPDAREFITVETSDGAAFVEQRTEYRELTYFDGRRQADLQFVDGRLEGRHAHPLLDFEEDRVIFAGIFQYFYLRLAIFFGCLGMFMYLFRGEMANRTLHYWLLAPARREVLLAGKFVAGLIAAMIIFGGGALLAFVAMVWPQDAVERQVYLDAGGMAHAFWYVAAAAFGCLGYGSVFLAAGLYVRNPIILAALLLAWESIQGILPYALQKVSVLYYLQSLCPVPAPMESDAPALIQLLAAPAAPASRPAAMFGLILLAACALWIASRFVRRMEITYGGES